jgi:hypothetical protein
MRRKAHLLNEYGAWLSDLDEWDAWFTFTWRDRVTTRSNSGRYAMNDRLDNISLPAVRRAMIRWSREVQPASIFWATESGSINQRNHVHGLIKFDNRSDTAGAWKLAYRWFGRSEIDPYDPLLGAGHYVGKYVSKGLTDHDYWRSKDGIYNRKPG